MNKTMRWVLFLIILLALYATNPTKTDFKEYADDYVKTEIKKAGVTSNSFLDSLIGLITGSVTETAVDILVSRENYYLFSIYNIQGIDVDYKFLGIFRSFIPIKNYIDVKKINISFRDPRAIIDTKWEIQEDYYRYYEIKLDGPTEININSELLSGPPIDIYFVDQKNFEIYKNRTLFSDSKVSYYPTLSQSGGSRMNKKEKIDKGIYYIIFENTDFGSTIPPMNFENDICSTKVKVLLRELY